MIRVLITRPQADALKLQHQLNQFGLGSLCQPLFEIVPGRELGQLQRHLTKADIVIAVSKHALLQAANEKPNWPERPYLAIGGSTQKQWQQLHPFTVFAPPIETSEGLLSLPQLASVSASKVLILRGQSGRELLGKELRSRGAQVQYCECYRRQPIELCGAESIQQWQQQGITHWVVTSEEQLSRVEQFCPKSEKHWLYQRKIITVSPRLAKQAQRLGFQQVEQSMGATNDELVAALTKTREQADPNE